MRRPLQWQTVHDAIAVPLYEPLDNSKGAGVVASSVDGFRYVRSSGLRRFSRTTVPPPKVHGLAAKRSIPRAIFGGYHIDHFGHFLLESLSRLWIEKVQNIDISVPLVLLVSPDGNFSPWASEVCRQIGLHREIVFVESATGPLAIEELIVPQAAFELREWMHPLQMRRLGTTSWNPESSGTRVWLSRAGIGMKAGFIQEREIEATLAELGWSIVQPELLAVSEQVNLLAGASHVAGVEGSALHGLVLVSGFGGTVDIVRRNSSPNYNAIALAGGWDQRFLDAVGGQTTRIAMANGLNGATITFPEITGIDPVATALRIDRSSRRRIRTTKFFD